MVDILHRITIRAPAEKIVETVSTAEGIRCWWTADCDVAPRVGAIDVFRFEGKSVEFHFRVDEISPNRIAWICVPAAKTPDEWVSTRIEFSLRPDAEGTMVLSFAHRGWASDQGRLPQRNTVWGERMHRLKASAEGTPRAPYFAG